MSDFEINIRPGEEDGLPSKRPPAAIDRAAVHGRPSAESVQVIMHPQALHQVDAHAQSDLRSEVGGLLLGEAYQHNGRIYVQVQAAIAAVSDQHGPVHFTFTADAWASAHAEKEARYPNLHIVGWFHTHPNLGVFYSADDVVVHTTAFRMPWQIGLVVDPIRREACLFGWYATTTTPPELIIDPLPGFYELTLNETSDPAVNWRYTTLYEVWEDDPPTAGGDMAYRAAVWEGRDRPTWTAFWTTVAGTAAIIVGLGILLIWWPLSQRADVLETVAASLAEERRITLNTAGIISCPSPDFNLITPTADATILNNEMITFIGTADADDALRYELTVQSAEATAPVTIAAWAGSRQVEPLGRWQPEPDTAVGEYTARLVGIGSGNRRLDETACELSFVIVAAPELQSPQPIEVPVAGTPPTVTTVDANATTETK